MKKLFALTSAAAVAAVMVSAGGASAAGFSHGFHHFRPHHHHHFHKPPKPPKPGAPTQTNGSSRGAKGPSALGQYMLFSTFCAAGSLIVQSAYVGNTENRELTSQEAFYTTGNCFLPVVGGPLFWALANAGNAPN